MPAKTSKIKSKQLIISCYCKALFGKKTGLTMEQKMFAAIAAEKRYFEPSEPSQG